MLRAAKGASVRSKVGKTRVFPASKKIAFSTNTIYTSPPSAMKAAMEQVKMPQDAGCLFCKIIHREVKADIVFEDDVCLAFLDHRPLLLGHCLLVTKQHVETLIDLPDAMIAPFFRATQKLAGAVEAAMAAEGTFVAINNRVSQSVPHLHVHIVPRKRG